MALGSSKHLNARLLIKSENLEHRADYGSRIDDHHFAVPVS